MSTRIIDYHWKGCIEERNPEISITGRTRHDNSIKAAHLALFSRISGIAISSISAVNRMCPHFKIQNKSKTIENPVQETLKRMRGFPLYTNLD
jgi:hypothetical protein